MVLTPDEAADLEDQGDEVELKTNAEGQSMADASTLRAEEGFDIWRPWSGDLTFALSYDTEIAYDHVIVEATAADGTRTTLPEAGGLTTTASAACSQYPGLHPSLLVYAGIGACQSDSTTGTWNWFNGSSGGWQDVAFDLDAHAGQEVAVSIGYVTDAAAGGVGVFVDNVQVPGEDVEGFEDALGAWTVPGAPEGSPANTTDWQQGGTLFLPAAGVETDDTVLFRFGLEHIEDPAVRATTLERVLDHRQRAHAAPGPADLAPLWFRR
jgi:hypothetical protein